MIYTADELIAAIKRNAGIPSSQRRFDDTDFLRFLNEELELTIVTDMIKLRQDYFIETESRSIVALQSEYPFPDRAISWKIDSIGYLDTASKYKKLNKIQRSQKGMYQSLQASSIPGGFYVEGTNIVLCPPVGTTPIGTLELDFVRLQNELVKVSSCGIISVVEDLGTDYRLTLNSVPTTGAVDVIGGLNPFNIIARAMTTTIASPQITVTKTGFERAPVAGDYVAETGKTPIPNIPEDIHPLLAQAATIRCLIAMNDMKGLQTAQIGYANMKQALASRADERVDTAPTKIVTTSHILNMMR
jgi:hypothetical protein